MSEVTHMFLCTHSRTHPRTKVHYLVAGVNSVRKLVRVKIADDNDLEQARRAVKTAVDFFKQLQVRACVSSQVK